MIDAILTDAAIAGGSSLALTSAWWRWKHMDRATLYRLLALRLMAKAAGLDAREKAEAEAIGKELVLR